MQGTAIRISSQKFRNYRPFLKPLLLISILAGLSFGIFFFIIHHWLNTLFINIELQQLQSLQQIVSVARNAAEPILADVRNHKITVDEGRRRIRLLVRNMTYSDQYGRNYVFMSTYDGTMLVQPFEPDKELTNQWDLQDAKGLYIIRELVRAAKENPGGAFVRYYYHLPDVHGTQEKLAYVIGLPELKCYIGTGMYMQRAIANQKDILKKIGSASVVLFVVLLIPLSASLVFILIRNRLLLGEITKREQVEKALKESESNYRSIFENSVEGIFQSSLDGHLISVNPAFARIAGYGSPREMIENSSSVAEYYENLEERNELLKAIEENGRITDYKIRITHRDGHYIWISINARLVKGEQGNVQYYEGTIEDITERRLAEENVRASRKLLSDILQAASEFAIIATDPKGMITIFNSGAERMLGYSADEVTGRHTPLLFHLESDIAERSRELSAELGHYVNGFRVFSEKSSTQGSETREWTYVRKDGSHLFVLVVFTAIRSERGEITGYLGIASDITQRKQAEAMSRLSEEKFSKVFMTTPDFIGITRMSDGKIIDVNRGFEEITGWRREDVIGRTSADIKFWANPEERDLMVAQLEAGKDVIHCEFKFRKIGGELRTGIYSARTIEIAGEQCLIFIMQDITERKQLEEERQKLAQQLFQSQKMDAVGQLAGGVAHDFNNILTGIQGNASLMLLDLKSDHAHYKRLRLIEEQIGRGAHLTRQLLGFAREGKYEVKTISINELIHRSAHFFIETRKEIECDLQLHDDVYPVNADAGQIEQVLVNLYINAGHAMPKGGRLLIQTSNTTLFDIDAEPMEIKPGNYVKISVTDTGIGMDRETLKRIFEPFFTTKSKQGGSGLGLASAYGIIRNHGGAINAYSEPGQGATFNIYLPASTQKSDEAEDPENEKGPSAGSGGVLLIDDESMILETASELLRMLGYVVYRAASGQEAVSIYYEKKSRIDLVILDMIMPGISGQQVLKLLKEINPEVKVILSSGYSMQGEVQKVMESGCAAFLQKPYNFKELSNILQQVMNPPT